jgi:hypothetical protein
MQGGIMSAKILKLKGIDVSKIEKAFSNSLKNFLDDIEVKCDIKKIEFKDEYGKIDIKLSLSSGFFGEKPLTKEKLEELNK